MTMESEGMKSMRPHIGLFGKRNSGKSSIVNAIAGQDVAIVSPVAGTTTDPVHKVMEITGFGPVVLIDTAGIDDEGAVGVQRVARSEDAVRQSDLAILVITGNTFGYDERRLVKLFEDARLPFFVVHNMSDIEDLRSDVKSALENEMRTDVIAFSAVDRRNFNLLLEKIRANAPDSRFNNPSILGDLVSYGDTVVLVTPIDAQAPKGRLILPQVQTIRDCLDNDCVVIVLKERELDAFFRTSAAKPALVVTDSQEFMKVAASVPPDIPLTSFSILFARLKGDFAAYVEGTRAISRLQEGDRVLILESCSHHVGGDDIGRVKIPRWLANFTGRTLGFDVVAGLDNPPLPVEQYSLVIQCGGCMLTRTQVMNRILPAVKRGIPVSNYGMTIAYCLGIFERAIEVFNIISNPKHDYI